MKKEKSVRTYQRKSKSGKIVTVRSYKAKYDAAEEARKEMAKRAGAGDELKKRKSAAPADLGFTADEFKIWANDLDEKEAKRIDKILVKKYGEKAVQKLADEINAGNSRTYKAVFARLTSEGTKKTQRLSVSRKAMTDASEKKNQTIAHYDQMNRKYIGKKVGEPFKFSDDGGSYDAHFVTDGRGRYGYVVRDADDPKGKFYVGIDVGTPDKKVLAAAKKAGLSFDKKSGKFIKMDKTTKSLPEIKIPEKPKLRDKNFSSKISDYNSALDYRHYREAVLRGDKKAISDAKYNLTGYLREEADSTSLTQKISKLTGIPLGASRDASKSSAKTTKTKLQAKIDERKGKFIVSSSGKPLKNAVNAAIAKAKREAYIEKSPYKDVLKRYSGDALVVALQRRGVEYKKAVSISNRLQALKAQERSVEFRGK